MKKIELELQNLVLDWANEDNIGESIKVSQLNKLIKQITSFYKSRYSDIRVYATVVSEEIIKQHKKMDELCDNAGVDRFTYLVNQAKYLQGHIKKLEE